jgi:hypothetical protein
MGKPTSERDSTERMQRVELNIDHEKLAEILLQVDDGNGIINLREMQKAGYLYAKQNPSDFYIGNQNVMQKSPDHYVGGNSFYDLQEAALIASGNGTKITLDPDGESTNQSIRNMEVVRASEAFNRGIRQGQRRH